MPEVHHLPKRARLQPWPVVMRAVGHGGHARLREAIEDWGEFPFHLLEKRRFSTFWRLRHIGRVQAFSIAVIERDGPDHHLPVTIIAEQRASAVDSEANR